MCSFTADCVVVFSHLVNVSAVCCGRGVAWRGAGFQSAKKVLRSWGEIALPYGHS